MYYVSLAGRNYNLQIRPLALAGAQLAVFRTVLESCTGPRISSSCDIEMGYYWATAGAGDGYAQITIFSGSGEASTTPAPGNALTSLVILNITASCAGFNAVEACTSNVDTTTTTTTTSTTTTTTTATITDPGSATIKFDQYSSSYSAPTWTNIGNSGSAYNLTKPSTSTVNSGGSGTAVYLNITGALSGPQNDEVFYSGLDGSFVNLSNISFSYAMVFRVNDISAYTTSAQNLSYVYATTTPNGFYLNKGADLYSTGLNYIELTLYKENNSFARIKQNISNSAKWYLVTCTFDKAAASADALKMYINLSKYSTTTGNHPASPSTFFGSNTYIHSVGTSPAPIRVAAIMFWQNKVLTDSEIQNLYNEYNTRYTLG